MRPPYGDQAAQPVSSYSTTSTFGEPWGARSGRNADQSGVESRTSRSMWPLSCFGMPSPPLRRFPALPTNPYQGCAVLTLVG